MVCVCLGLAAVVFASGPRWGPWGLGFLLVFAATPSVLLLYLDLSGKANFYPQRGNMTEWWYNNKTKQVEEGPQSLGSDRDGPYVSREEAERAPEIAAERARKWAAEDD